MTTSRKSMVNRRMGLLPSKLDGIHLTSTAFTKLDERVTNVIDGA